MILNLHIPTPAFLFLSVVMLLVAIVTGLLMWSPEDADPCSAWMTTVLLGGVFWAALALVVRLWCF